jgi:hypothetical protein
MVGGSQSSSVRRHRQFLSGNALFALIDRCPLPTAETATFRASDGECLEKNAAPRSSRRPADEPHPHCQPNPRPKQPSRIAHTTLPQPSNARQRGEWGTARGMGAMDLSSEDGARPAAWIGPMRA